MVHTLRKYLSNRGSALFMVISTMTALMIACMAMYFSVVSSRQTQFATFFQQQSYQSAVSLNDMVLAGLMDGSLTGDKADLLTVLADMNVGDTITTGASGFTSFDSTLSGSDIEQMGAYSMDITRLPDEVVNGSDNMTFDIATTTINNGVAETVHTYIHIQMAPEEIPNGDNIFAATGYVPNDAYLDAGFFMTDVFFDTEYTYVSLYKNASRFVGNFRTGGSAIILKRINPLGDGGKLGDNVVSGKFQPTVWGIRQDLIIGQNGSGALSYRAGSKIFVGRNLEFKSNGGLNVVEAAFVDEPILSTTGEMDIYVLGDLNLNGCSIGFNRANVYVGGNISEGQITNALNIYVRGTDNSTKTGTTPASKKWDSSAPGMSYEEAKRELNRETYTKTYKKWVINSEDDTKDDYIKELDTRPGHNSSYKGITIRLNDDLNPHNGVLPVTSTYTIAYPGSDSAATIDPDDPTTGVICEAGVIEEVIGGFGYNAVNPTIILDTGDNENNILTLRVTGYLTRGSEKVFKWFPKMGNSGCTVLVKGKGIVVIDIPEDVIYEDEWGQQFLHYNWFTMLGGEEKTWTGSMFNGTEWIHGQTRTWYDSTAIQKNKAILATSIIHNNCENGDGCTYYTEAYKDKSGDIVKCEKHNEEKIVVKCNKHGSTSVAEFCPKCDEFNAKKVDKLVNNTHDEGVCRNRLDKDAYNAYAASHPECTGMPNTNIFLVCSNESSEIRLASDTYRDPGTSSGVTYCWAGPSNILQNGFYGFIYAPYMTFKAEGQSGAGSCRFLGGLVVSDYAINDFYAFANCYPDKMPNDLMGESSENMQGLAGQSWKINLGSY